MSEFVFENQGTNTYLVYAIAPDDVVDSMSLGMLTNNKIAGLATTLFTQMDANKYIKYNVSAKVSAKQFFAGAVNKKRLLGVFKGIVNALLSAEDYMIDERTILLDMDYIFADVSTCETVLICLPVQSCSEQHDLGAFFKNIMFSTQFDQTENCDHVAKIINYLNSTPLFSLNDFKDLLDSIDETSAPITAKPVQPKVQPAEQPKVEKPAQPVVQKPVVEAPPKAPVTTPANPPQVKAQVPVPPAKQPVAQPQAQAPAQPEKKISMFGLLMHYSKENAELYKAQKSAQKGAAPAVKPQTPPKASNPGFAVPGQPAQNAGFAIPGQPAPAVAPAQSAQPKVNTPPAQAPVQAPASAPAAAPAQPAFVPRQMPQGQSANFGETTVLGGGAIGETTVLTAAQNPNKVIAPHLIRKKNNEKISLNKPVFRIGKERSYVDYFIGDNTAISRSHANFITRDGEYLVVDTNSTNHTFVNGTMIQSNVETPINHGDTIRLANEDFEFKLY